MPRKEPCCLGERSLDGDPHGMHSMDCPVYLANVAAWEQRHRRTPTPVGATTPRANEEAASVGATDPRCHCGHLESQHRARVVLGRYIDTCLVCDCTDFGAVDEVEEEPTTVLYAWDAALCRQCEWRTSAPDLLARPDSRCLQCGAALTPVRLEMHSREPL